MSTKQLRTTLTAAQLAASGQFLTATSTDAEATLGHTTRAEAKSALGLGTSLTVTANNGGGSADTPAYTFVGDPDTGMFNPSGDVLAFSTDGSDRMHITGAGNVGIRISNPVTDLQVGRSFPSESPDERSSYIAGQYNFSTTRRTNAGESLRIDFLVDSNPLYFDFVMTAYLTQGFDSDRVAARQHRFRGCTDGVSFLLENFSEIYNETLSSSSRFGLFTCTLPGSGILRFTMPNTSGARDFRGRGLLTISGMCNAAPILNNITVV